MPRLRSTANERASTRHTPARPGHPCHARRRDGQPRRPRPVACAAIDPVRDQRHGDEGRAEEQRLCHRRALKVKDVRVYQEQCRGCGASRDRAGPLNDERGQRPCAGRHAHHRYGDRRRAGSVPRIHLHRDHVQEMREGKPDGANLLPSRHQAVEDAARHDEMRARIVVAECQASARVIHGSGAASKKRSRRDHQGRRAHHVFADVRLDQPPLKL